MSNIGTLEKLKINRRGLMLVLSSPSGAGKTALSRALVQRHSNLIISVSVTTRVRRPGERDGIDYYYVDQSQFDEKVAAQEFLEYATVFENSYGTLRQPIMDTLSAGKDVLFDVDWQGAQQIRENAPKDLISIFILPPSIKELERRLRSRAQDSEAELRRRMAMAGVELSHWQEYEYIIVNDEFQESLLQVESIINAEILKRHRQIDLKEAIRDLEARD